MLDQDAAGPSADVETTARLTQDVLRGFGRAADHLYSKALNGFSVELTEAEAVAISEDPRVAFVEEDSVMETQITQTNPPWGLDRINQRTLPLTNIYSYTTTGAGVNVYVIDTGIRLTHTDSAAARLPPSIRSEGMPSTATATELMCRERLGDRRTVWPKVCGCSPFAC